MTFWAKLLTVIVLVLSIAFAALSGAVFSKRENYRGQLETEKQAGALNQKQLNERIQSLESERDLKDAELTNAMTTLDTQQRELQSLQSEVEQRRLEAEDHKTRMEALTDVHAQVVASLDATVARNRALSNDNDKIVNENRTLLANLSAEQERANDLETLNASLTNQRDELKVALASAKETIQTSEDIFAELERNQIAVAPIVEKIIKIDQIRGRVASVDDKSKVVILNVGSNDGVRKNYPFTVWRDGSFVAKINVYEIYDRYSVARVVDRKLEIKQGDNAWTRMY